MKWIHRVEKILQLAFKLSNFTSIYPYVLCS